jgi:hypothetical protein
LDEECIGSRTTNSLSGYTNRIKKRPINQERLLVRASTGYLTKHPVSANLTGASENFSYSNGTNNFSVRLLWQVL